MTRDHHRNSIISSLSHTCKNVVKIRQQLTEFIPVSKDVQLGINGGESRVQPAKPCSPRKMAVKVECVYMFVCSCGK